MYLPFDLFICLCRHLSIQGALDFEIAPLYVCAFFVCACIRAEIPFREMAGSC